MYNKRI